VNFGNGDVLLWMFEFFLFVIWFWLLLTIFTDLFRDHELSGGVKALWVIFVVLVPYIGILVYLIARGRGMADRAAQIREVAGTSPSPADQIAQAKSLLDSGTIDQAEFNKLKARALGS
jgi:cbb3-type cytochrome oxidase subunit 3